MLEILANYKVILASLLAALIIGMAVYIKILRLERDKAVSNNAVLTMQLQTQNKAIAQMQEKAKQQQEILLKAEKQAQIVAKKEQTEIAQILNSKVPLECNGAVKWGAIQSAKIAREFS
jgi:hypothetical protein